MFYRRAHFYKDPDKDFQVSAEILVLLCAAGLQCVAELKGELADGDDVANASEREGDLHNKLSPSHTELMRSRINCVV